jgi:hypothetical protein
MRQRRSIHARGSMGNKSKRNRRSKSVMVAADTQGQAKLSGQLDPDMRAKCAEIAANIPSKPRDMASIIRDAQKLFDWITTGNLPEPRTPNDGGTIGPHSGEDADIGRSKGESLEGKLPLMPAVTAFDNVVEQIVRDARDDEGVASGDPTRSTAQVRTP